MTITSYCLRPHESSMASYRLPQHLTLQRAVPLSIAGMSFLGFIPRWQSCLRAAPGSRLSPCAHGTVQSSLPSWRCHCLWAAASHTVYFWKSLNFTVEDVPDLVRKSSGGTEHLSACFVTCWSDSVNKTEFDSPSPNLSG